MSDRNHNNNKTSTQIPKSKNSTRNANMHLLPGHKMPGRPRYDETTSYRRREHRLDGFLFFNFLASVLKDWFLMRGPTLTVELISRFSYKTWHLYTRAFWAQCRCHNYELEWVIRGPILLYDLPILPSWKQWVELKRLRAGHRRKGSTRSEGRKRKHALGWYGRDCRRGMWCGLPAVLKTRLWRHKTVWSQSIYILQYIVYNAGRHDTDFREVRVNEWLEFLQFLGSKWRVLS